MSLKLEKIAAEDVYKRQSLHSQVSDWDWKSGYMFAHLQVHMQMENHYSSAHKGAMYKAVSYTHL